VISSTFENLIVDIQIDNLLSLYHISLITNLSNRESEYFYFYFAGFNSSNQVQRRNKYLVRCDEVFIFIMNENHMSMLNMH
jgi:hypothetical protein